MSKTVLILGAGVGGLTTADTLRQLLPPEDRIILVDRSFDGTLGLSLLWVLRGWRRPDDVRVRPTAASLPGVEMVTATVAHIDIAAQVVHTDNSVIGYDALVIALGAALNTDAVPGLSDALDADVAGQFYTLVARLSCVRRSRRSSMAGSLWLSPGCRSNAQPHRSKRRF